MNKKLTIITSSIAACAIFASFFAFNGNAVGTQKVETQKVKSTVTSVKPDTVTKQAITPASTTESKSQNTKSDTKAIKTNTTSVKNSQTSPATQNTQGSNNQQTNIDSAKPITNLRNTINNANCDKTTAKTGNYSALKSKLEALLKSNSGTSATKPTTNTTATKPSTSTKPSMPTNGDYSAFQKKVVELVNVERSKNGLKPLKMNTELSKVATLKSQDMAKLNYFSHTSPTYGSPFDMMKKYGISYRTAGENIAMGQSTPEQVMQGWMNSSGHRANILKSSFTQIGVGIAKNSKGQLYWTQQFIG